MEDSSIKPSISNQRALLVMTGLPSLPNGHPIVAPMLELLLKSGISMNSSVLECINW